MQLQVNEQTIEVSNLEKVFWPEEGYSKGDVLNYYAQISAYLLPHLQDRPLVLVRYPDGINGNHFYQKDFSKTAPPWLKTVSVKHSANKTVAYCLCNDLQTLLWLVNQGAIELHPWLSRTPSLRNPDYLVLDLDPAPASPFADVIFLALMFKQVLAEFGLQGFLKTSGASGLHIFVPLIPQYTYPQVTKAGEFLANIVAAAYPKQATVERLIKHRGERVYLDYLQNGYGKTLVSVYGLRPELRAPVSIPLTWEEISQTGPVSFHPADFNIKTAISRVEQVGDRFAPVLSLKQNLDGVLRLVNQKNLH